MNVNFFIVIFILLVAHNKLYSLICCTGLMYLVWMCSLCMCTVIFQIHDKMMYEEHVYNVLSSHFSVIDKLCQGLKIALCVSLALVLSFITVWECCTHTHTHTHWHTQKERDNSSLVDSSVSASEPVRAAVILIPLLRAVNHGLKRLHCVKMKLCVSL